MANNSIKNSLTGVPIDRVAARVVSSGFKYEPVKVADPADSTTPIPTRNIPRSSPASAFKFERQMIGRRMGRLTVIGLAHDVNKRWVVRCDCGMYSMRTAKAIQNPSNSMDCCSQCRHLLHLKRNDFYRRTGKDVALENL